MNFIAAKSPVYNRGTAPDAFLEALATWGQTAPDVIFARNDEPHDIMDQIFPILGHWESPLHRRAALIETMRVLAGFESTWKPSEGKDSDNHNQNPESWEAGAWQVSYDSRNICADLRDLLKAADINNAIEFQIAMQTNFPLSAEYIARLLRHTWQANGPCYKDRSVFRPALRGEEQSIYPWLLRDSVREFMVAMS
jgi:hypothetical protein